jgi:hypothetical protein
MERGGRPGREIIIIQVFLLYFIAIFISLAQHNYLVIAMIHIDRGTGSFYKHIKYNKLLSFILN